MDSNESYMMTCHIILAKVQTITISKMFVYYCKNHNMHAENRLKIAVK